MTGVLCLFCANGDIPHSDVAQFAGAMEQSLQRPVQQWHAPGLLLGASAPSRNTRTDQIAVIGESGRRLAMVGEVRLDNREELLDRLDQPETAGRTLSDAAVILRAFQRWGDRCLEHLLGDFAFVIWDEAESSLFLARDPVGIKSLYYYDRDGRFYCSNDPRSLLTHPAVGWRIDLESLAEYFVDGEVFDPAKTLIEGVFRVPPATMMRVGRSVEQRTYWRLQPGKELRYRDDAEYVDHLDELLRDSISARTRGQDRVACQLSGGLDSSTIGALAAERSHEALLAYNWSEVGGPPEDPQAFEWALAQQVAEAAGMELFNVPLTGEALVRYLQNVDVFANESVDAYYEFVVLPMLADRGVTAVLSGWGGDELVSNYGLRASIDALSRGRPMTSIRNVDASWQRSKRRLRSLPGIVRRELLWPVTKLSGESRQALPSFLTDEFAKRVKATESRQQVRRSFSQRHQLLDLYSIGHLAHRAESWNILGRRYGIDYHFPLLDRRILEFVMSVPSEQFRRGRETRYLFRRLANRHLPDGVADHTNKLESNRVSRLLGFMAEALVAYDQWAVAPAQMPELLSESIHLTQLRKHCLEAGTLLEGENDAGAELLEPLFNSAVLVSGNSRSVKT